MWSGGDKKKVAFIILLYCNIVHPAIGDIVEIPKVLYNYVGKGVPRRGL